MKVALDTNVLAYAEGVNDVEKREIALELARMTAYRTPHRVSFLYFTRCGMMLSWPRRRILSFS